MIRVTRLHYMSPTKLAGDFYDFCKIDEKENCEDVFIFLWGKDINDYLVTKNGQEVDLRGHVTEIERVLMDFKNY